MEKIEELKIQILKLYKKQQQLLNPLNIAELNKINTEIYKLRQIYKAEKHKERQAESQQTAQL